MTRHETLTARSYTYTVLFEQDEEVGGYIAVCPALPGLVTQGNTLEEARAMALDAITGYLEILREDGLPIPPGEDANSHTLRERLTVTLKSA